MKCFLSAMLLMASPAWVSAHSASPFILPEVFDVNNNSLMLYSGITADKFYVPTRNFTTDYVVTNPDATQTQVTAAARLSRMTVAEVALPMDGTYRIRTENTSSNKTDYALVDGQWLRIRAPRPASNTAMPMTMPITIATTAQTAVANRNLPDKAEAAKPDAPKFLTPDQVPATAKRMTTVNTPIAESYVSKGKPSAIPAALQQGLSLQLLSHPNELFVGDELKAQILLNGQALKDVQVDVYKGATAYDVAAKRELPEVKSDAKGELRVPLKAAGVYLLTFVYPAPNSDTQTTPPEQSYSYGLTFEVTE